MQNHHGSKDWASFIAVTFIWSTTPLAIVISNQSIDPYLSLAARMLISLLALSLWFVWRRHKLPFYRSAWPTHLAVGVIGIGLSMSLVYLAAQHLPSSWIALIFGLAPLFTGILEGLFFRSLKLHWQHWAGISVAIGGLWLIFHDPTQQLTNDLSWSIIAMIASTFLHSLSASLVKRIQHRLSPLDTVFGGLSVALPITLLFWWLNGAQVPHDISKDTALSIIYLGIIGSLAGFLLYYQVLANFSATLSSFITILSPTLALIWGGWWNNEPLTINLLLGSCLILIGLTVFIFKSADK